MNRRYTVVLADDEPLILAGIAKLIDWASFDIEIVGQAKDGESALALVREKRPDMLISDIHMPKLSGIEVLCKINEENLGTQVIFISGFHEFEYAHAAVRHGAKDFILKPVHKERLESAIIKIIEPQRKEGSFSVEKELHVKPLTAEKAISHVLTSFMSEVEDLGNYRFAILYGAIDFFDKKTYSEEEQTLITFSAKNMIQEYAHEADNVYFLEHATHMMVLVLVHSEQTIPCVAKQLCTLIEEQLHEKLLIAPSEVVSDHHVLISLYEASRNYRENRFFYHTIGGAKPRYLNKLHYTLENLFTYQDSLYKALLTGQPQQVQCEVNLYADTLQEVTFDKKHTAVSLALGALVTIRKRLMQVGIQFEQTHEDELALQHHLQEMNTFAQLTQWIHESFEQLFLQVSRYREKKSHQDIYKITSYIEAYYYDDISLQDVAELVHLHPNYVSTYFKKQTGRTFKDYLTSIRMDKAKSFMLNSNMRVYEIAEKTGFTDYRHFSKVFKKAFGVSPREMKKRYTYSQQEE